MAELQRASVTGGGLYERLLQRLALALDEADTAERLRDEHPMELELRGLSSAEMGLIRAYLDQDVHWLRGWHAAAEELALLEPFPGPRAAPCAPRCASEPSAPGAAPAAAAMRAVWLAGRLEPQPGCVALYVHCGSQLFRSGNGR